MLNGRLLSSEDSEVEISMHLEAPGRRQAKCDPSQSTLDDRIKAVEDFARSEYMRSTESTTNGAALTGLCHLVGSDLHIPSTCFAGSRMSISPPFLPILILPILIKLLQA